MLALSAKNIDLKSAVSTHYERIIQWSTKGVNPQCYYTLASYYKDQKNNLFGVVSIWICQSVARESRYVKL